MTNIFRSNFASTSDSSSASSNGNGLQCWVSFGGNLDDVKKSFDDALELLDQDAQIELGQRSGLYRTTPMGAKAGQSFLNSVGSLTTQFTPYELLSVLQSVENRLGRVRDIRWGPRTIDLDLLSYGNQIIDEPNLVIPHPGLTYRRFVLDPLLEVDPNWMHPKFSATAQELVTRLNARPLRASLLGISPGKTEELEKQLKRRFPNLQLVSDHEHSENVLPIQTTLLPVVCKGAIVDLRRSPGDLFEQLTSAFTSMFDVPNRISDW